MCGPESQDTLPFAAPGVGGYGDFRNIGDSIFKFQDGKLIFIGNKPEE